MIQKMKNNPEDVLLVSGVKQIGDDVRLYRERTALTIIGVSDSDSQLVSSRLAELASGGITDSKKPSLQRELDIVERGFATLRREARETSLGDSAEMHATQEAYDRLYALLTKIINSSGTYSNPDVSNIEPYYTAYNDSANELSNLIIEVQTQNGKESGYYSMTIVTVETNPQSVPSGSSTLVAGKIYYKGDEKTGDTPANAFTFGLTGLSDSVTQATRATYFPDISTSAVEVTDLTHTAVVSGVKSFSLTYDGIGDNGVNVICQISLDSENMPF